ncbi:MAG: TrmH family RNA methyltransferase, partial [Acidimicrobiales bacterium]
SSWAAGVLERIEVVTRYEVTDALMAGLSGKEEPAEVLLVARMPDRSLGGLSIGPDSVVCVVDRIASPGNLGSIVRSADAFGAAGVVTVGHAADPYDPTCVRASTGSIFSVPVVAVAGMEEVVGWSGSTGLRLVGADESGPALAPGDLAPPVAVVLGSEGRGLSRAAVESCQRLVSIPMRGGASSLNVASAATVLLYESRR